MIAGEPLCDRCAVHTLSAITVQIAEGPRIEGELPPAKRPRQHKPGARAAERRTTRGRADRAALQRLKVMHLPEYNALIADELARTGHVPTKARSLDNYLRLVASQRLAALHRRLTDA